MLNIKRGEADLCLSTTPTGSSRARVAGLGLLESDVRDEILTTKMTGVSPEPLQTTGTLSHRPPARAVVQPLTRQGSLSPVTASSEVVCRGQLSLVLWGFVDSMCAPCCSRVFNPRASAPDVVCKDCFQERSNPSRRLRVATMYGDTCTKVAKKGKGCGNAIAAKLDSAMDAGDRRWARRKCARAARPVADAPDSDASDVSEFPHRTPRSPVRTDRSRTQGGAVQAAVVLCPAGYYFGLCEPSSELGPVLGLGGSLINTLHPPSIDLFWEVHIMLDFTQMLVVATVKCTDNPRCTWIRLLPSEKKQNNGNRWSTRKTLKCNL